MLMEALDYNKLVAPRLTRVIEAAKSVGRFLTISQLASHGDHIPSWLEPENTGAGPAFDEALYDEVKVEGFLYDGRE